MLKGLYLPRVVGVKNWQMIIPETCVMNILPNWLTMTHTPLLAQTDIPIVKEGKIFTAGNAMIRRVITVSLASLSQLDINRIGCLKSSEHICLQYGHIWDTISNVTYSVVILDFWLQTTNKTAHHVCQHMKVFSTYVRDQNISISNTWSNVYQLMSALFQKYSDRL